MGNLTELTDGNFASKIAKGAAMVKFWAEWWGACKTVAPVVEQVAQEFKGKVQSFGANTDETGKSAAGLGIMSIPATLFFKDGKEVSRIVGTAPKAKFVAEMEKITK